MLLLLTNLLKEFFHRGAMEALVAKVDGVLLVLEDRREGTLTCK